ncbi:hypothetical protein [Muriicola soli]|uniref:Uncharacterized protein n=1 Tax=Muriicola soli TaxID=2507538 RepID=A0A411E9D4_9FLAO|nr:hypothetical protein [Muriicola soli]QBA64070.1 hypothetical protein EQY75_05675 [Muriicola soli]
MSIRYVLIALFFLSTGFTKTARASDAYVVKEDPIEVSKKIITDDPLPWTAEEHQKILEKLGPVGMLGQMDKNYLLLQSPWLGTEYLQGAFDEGVNSIPVEQLLDLLNLAANSPQQTSRKLAEISIKQALREYDKAFQIAASLKGSSTVAYDDAIDFLQSRFGYLKVKTAKNLLDESALADNAVLDKKTGKKISDRFKNIRKKYTDEIPLTNALNEVKAFYTLLEDVVGGLAKVEPYTKFTQTITELNEVQLRERKHWRSALEITYPDKGTVWTIPDEVSIQWTTENLPPEKTIKFYLLRDNTVIEELGIFKNTAVASGIKLNKTLPRGTNYRIMGIELFPADKFHTAKFATPYFTIDKRDPNTPPPPVEEILVVEEKPGPEIEEEVMVTEEVVVAAAPPVKQQPEVEVEPVEAITETSIPDPVVREEIAVEEKVEKRTDFGGRSITYVKELEVNNKIVKINLWDHGRKDGDIVSIYLNGYPIVSEYLLTYQKKGFELKLDPSKPNDLFLYAHNLGQFPPNTVSIEIIDGDASENIILNSDLSRCEAVLINVKQ